MPNKIDLARVYDELDENGIDVNLPPSEVNRPFEYRPTALNESLVVTQQKISEIFSRFESDLISVFEIYNSLKEFNQKIKNYLYEDIPSIVPELMSTAAVSAIAYRRNMSRGVIPRLLLTGTFGVGTALFMFPMARQTLLSKIVSPLPDSVQQNFEKAKETYEAQIVNRVVRGWISAENWFERIKSKYI